MVAAVAKGAAHQLLVVAEAVHPGGVEVGDAAVEGLAEQGDGLALVGARAVDLLQAHAAEAEGRDGEAGLAEGAGFESRGVPPMQPG